MTVVDYLKYRRNLAEFNLVHGDKGSNGTTCLIWRQSGQDLMPVRGGGERQWVPPPYI